MIELQSADRMFLPDPESTIRAGRRLAAALRTRDDGEAREARSVHLSGPLGAGKTTLVRGLMRGLGHRGPVKSPTYTLLEPYEVEGLSVYHFDLYRLSTALELDDFGARDCFHERALCLVEWPERGEGALPLPDLVLEMREFSDGRELFAKAATREGRDWLAACRGRSS